MFDETLALTNRALKKWVRNPFTIIPGLATSAFYLALFGNSVGGDINPVVLGAPTYITYLAAGVICLITVFNMSFGGIDIVLDRQLGYFNTLLTAPIPRASIYLSGVFQNLSKAMLLAVLTFVIALVIPNGLELPHAFGILQLIGTFVVFGLLGLGLSFVFTSMALAARSIDSLIAVVNFINLPLIFMSSSLFPSNSFPSWLKAISNVNPISKADEAARILIVKGNPGSLMGTFVGDMAYLVGFVVVMGILGYLAAARAMRPE